MKALLAAGAKVDGKNNYHPTALDYSLENGHAEIVQVLLSAGAEVESNTLTKALGSASEKGYTELVKALLAADAEVNFKGYGGSTPLAHAASEGPGQSHEGSARFLLTTGC